MRAVLVALSGLLILAAVLFFFYDRSQAISVDHSAAYVQTASESAEKTGHWGSLPTLLMPGGATGACYLSVTKGGEFCGVIVNRGLSDETYFRVDAEYLSPEEWAVFQDNVDGNLSLQWDERGRLTHVRAN